MSAPVCNNGNNHSRTSCENNQDAKFRTNIPSPISKLPVELLCKIFHLNRPYSPPGPLEASRMSNKEFFDCALGWVAVTWVCRSWRRVALNDSTLWSEPHFSFPKWTTVMFERSKDVGITVNLDRFSCSSRGREIILPAIFANASRVAELMLRTDGSDAMLGLLVHFASTPKLSTLRLSTGGLYKSPRAIDLPSDLFHSTARLNYLDLEGFNINWDSHLLSNPLHTLILSNVSSSARPTISKFRSIFKRLSSTLNVLQLRGAIPIPSRADQNPDPALLSSAFIHLPLLKIIRLDAAPSELLSFFSNISPGDQMKTLQIVTSYDDLSRSAFISCLIMLHGHRFVAQLLSTIQHLRLFFITGGLRFYAYNEGGSPHHLVSALETTINNDPFSFNLDVKMRQMTASQQVEIAPSILEDTFHGLHWNHLCELEISFDMGGIAASPRLDDVLRSTFGTLTALQNIMAFGAEATSCIINILRTDPHPTSGATTSPAAIAFPGLKEFTIRGSSFRLRNRRKVKISHLRRAVRDRFKLGIPIEKIELSCSPGLSKKGVDSFSKYVVETDWDEYDDADYESEYDEDADESGDSEEDSDEEACQ